jgi:predicted  nucleic acid-binding Zn-ribbon protein
MPYKSNRAIYSRPSTYGGSKDNYMKAFLLTNELSRLEHERKMAVTKITNLENRIEDVRKEIESINTLFRESNNIIQNNIEPGAPKKRHVTIEY